MSHFNHTCSGCKEDKEPLHLDPDFGLICNECLQELEINHREGE